LDAEVDKNSDGFQFEFFWATTLLPDFSPFASFTLPGSADLSIATSNIMTWTAAGKGMERWRIDLGDRAGVTVKLKRLVFE
jgi:hypothetical protein